MTDRTGPDGARPRGPRRQGRERAVFLLYQGDLRGENPAELLPASLAADPLPEEADRFARHLVEGWGRLAAAVDEALAAAMTGRPLDRAGYLERAILRIGAFEIIGDPATPGAVAVDEAIELAKQFCDDDAGPLVNGVLDRILKRHAAVPSDGD